jgi:hypothetical protein
VKIWNFTRDITFYKLHAAVGDTWSFTYLTNSGGFDFHYIVTMQSRLDSIKTPAGKFENCLRYYFDDPRTIDDEFTDWLAPDVGLIFRCVMTPRELKEAIVNGIRYPPITSVNEQPPAATSQFELSQNYPNPFNPETVIEYEVQTSGRVVLQVVDVLGREVRKLVDGFTLPGHYTVVWDGKDTERKSVVSSVYICRLSLNESCLSKKMLYIK